MIRAERPIVHSAARILALLMVISASVRAQGTVVIRDDLERTVALPAGIERAISLEPEITRIIVALGAADRLVGIDFFLRYQDHVFPIIYPRSKSLPVVSNQGQELNYELALQLRPDVLFSSPSEFRMTETIERKMRRPVAALASRGRFEALLREIELLGRILGKEERAAELAAFFRREIEAVTEAEAARGRSKPSVYLSFWGNLLRTPVHYEPVDAAGGHNLATGLLPSRLGTAAATVPIERILLWDPDIILVQGNYPPGERLVTVEGILADPRFSSLRAVRGGRVHYTFGFWYWWDPALVLVETLYLARLFDPAGFAGFDLVEEGDRIFRTFYGVEGAFRTLCGRLGCHDWITD